MDSAILSATAALAGSLVGGISTLAASWLTQREQFRAQTLVQEAVNRQAVYAEFIVEASRRLTEAWSHHAESPEVVAGLYSAAERMRLTSSPKVVRSAEQVIRGVMEAYAAPDRTFGEFQERLEIEIERDPLREFSNACRADLSALRPLRSGRPKERLGLLSGFPILAGGKKEGDRFRDMRADLGVQGIQVVPEQRP
jgi:hypothetical protein